MKQLVRLLKLAHAIEIGAFHAYEGHWKSLPTSGVERLRVWMIQQEEDIHREVLAELLTRYGSKPSWFLNSVLWVIGKSIGLACRVMPRKASMWGAKIMELMGSGIYYKLAWVAADMKDTPLCHKFCELALAEEKHEQYFKELLK